MSEQASVQHTKKGWMKRPERERGRERWKNHIPREPSILWKCAWEYIDWKNFIGWTSSMRSVVCFFYSFWLMTDSSDVLSTFCLSLTLHFYSGLLCFVVAITAILYCFMEQSLFVITFSALIIVSIHLIHWKLHQLNWACNSFIHSTHSLIHSYVSFDRSFIHLNSLCKRSFLICYARTRAICVHR